jgi:hypothetical protein
MVQKKKGKKAASPTEQFLGIPCSLTNVPRIAKKHQLYIVVTGDCNWCYSDPDGCFGKTFLKKGPKRKGHVYGPYTPIKKGTVHINAVASAPGKVVSCDPFAPTPASGHTIIVGGP